MLREIKFRGKQENSDKWLVGDIIIYENGDAAIFEKRISRYGYESTQISKRTKIDSETICQFTGLVDNSGKEVYEHDIVRAFGLLCEVVYRTDLCSFVLLEIETQYVWGIPIGEMKKDFGLEVIGNIFDYDKIKG